MEVSALPMALPDTFSISLPGDPNLSKQAIHESHGRILLQYILHRSIRQDRFPRVLHLRQMGGQLKRGMTGYGQLGEPGSAGARGRWDQTLESTSQCSRSLPPPLGPEPPGSLVTSRTTRAVTADRGRTPGAYSGLQALNVEPAPLASVFGVSAPKPHPGTAMVMAQIRKQMARQPEDGPIRGLTPTGKPNARVQAKGKLLARVLTLHLE